MTTTEPAPASTPVPASGLLDKNLTEACRDTEAKIARVDTKASFLLAFDGAILAGLASLADKPLPLPAQIAGGGAALVLTAAAVLLLLAVRPNLGGRRRVVREGFPRWAELDEPELLAALAQDTRAIKARALSLLAVRKFQGLIRAVDTILAGLALLLLAAALAVTA
ncbi:MULTISPECIES: Pycsar system effector family protein [unclassified Streptomyces]|uniref:Pycsar system effector family protein n=1 Tax=unclassified Streptomyces TaxID=2593676 RepID=UPI0035DBBCFA